MISGNFFPISLDSRCDGLDVTVERTSKSAATKTERQTNWLLSLPDGTETTYTITCEDKVIAKLDFAQATLLKNATEMVSAYEQEHTSLGKSVKDIQSADLAIAPNGDVSGTLNYIPQWDEFSKGSKGYFVAVKLAAPYNGKPVTVKGKQTKTATDEEWILNVEDKDSTFKFSDGETELFTLNFRNTIFEERKVGAAAVIAPKGEEDMDFVPHASDLVASSYAISWDGTVGTLSGHIYWYEFTNGHFKDKPTGHYVPLIVNGYDGYKLTLTNSSGEPVELADPKWIIRVEDFISSGKDVNISCNGAEIATIKFGKLTLMPPQGSQVFTILGGEESVSDKTVSEYCSELAIESSSGTVVQISGTFLKKDDTSGKYLLPVKLNDYFKSGKNSVKIYGVDTIPDDMKILIPVVSNSSTIMIKYSSMIVAHIKFEHATFNGEV